MSEKTLKGSNPTGAKPVQPPVVGLVHVPSKSSNHLVSSQQPSQGQVRSTVSASSENSSCRPSQKSTAACTETKMPSGVSNENADMKKGSAATSGFVLLQSN